jgi:hypothetical protein
MEQEVHALQHLAGHEGGGAGEGVERVQVERRLREAQGRLDALFDALLPRASALCRKRRCELSAVAGGAQRAWAANGDALWLQAARDAAEAACNAAATVTKSAFEAVRRFSSCATDSMTGRRVLCCVGTGNRDSNSAILARSAGALF